MLKADLHIHTSEDPEDSFIRYDSREIIDHAAELGFDVIAITLHEKVIYDKKLSEYAKRKGILLIPGAEMNIEGRHVLIYNATQKEIDRIKNFSDLEILRKRKSILVVAPHPYYWIFKGLGKKLENNIKLFDAIEFSCFYFFFYNRPNKKAVSAAERYNKPFIATSDTHYIWQMGKSFTLIDSKKNIHGVLNAIRKGRVSIKTRPLSFFRIMKWLLFRR